MAQHSASQHVDPVARTPRRTVGMGILQLFVGRGVSVMLSFLGWTLIARALGPSPFGELQFLLALLSYVAFVADPGLTTLGTREYVHSSRPREMVEDVLGTRLLLAAASVGVIWLYAALAPLSAADRAVLFILASGQLALALNLSWVLRGQQRSTVIALVEVVSAAVMFAGGLAVWAGPRELTWAAVAAVSAPWVAAGAAYLAAIQGRLIVPRISVRAFPLLRRSLSLGIAAVAIAVYYTIDAVLLGLLRTNAEVGWYGAAYRLVLPWLTLASVVGWLAMPRLAELRSRNPAAIPPLLAALSRGMLLIALPLAVATSIVAPTVVRIVFGEAYAASALPLAILIWSTVTVFGNAPFGFLLLAQERDRRYMAIAIVGAIGNVALNLLLIPLLGMVGAAVGTLVTELLVFSAIVASTRRQSLRPLARALGAALVVAVAIAAVMLPMRESLLAIPAGLATYVLAIIVTGTMPLRRTLRLLPSSARDAKGRPR